MSSRYQKYEDFQNYLKNEINCKWSPAQIKAFARKTSGRNYTLSDFKDAADSFVADSNYKPTPKQIIDLLPRKEVLNKQYCQYCNGTGAICISIPEVYQDWKTKEPIHDSRPIVVPCVCACGGNFKRTLQEYNRKHRRVCSPQEAEAVQDKLDEIFGGAR